MKRVDGIVERIILFDGICNLCNFSVQFIIKRDPLGYFKFAALQGEIGQKLLEKHEIHKDFSSFILIENEQAYSKSTAALKVCLKLRYPWKLLSVLRILPLSLRDFLYDIISKNRYKWFGKKESCILPSSNMRKRFLD
ncbi:thiol-disulfide oxidoreductase DCC family protein [Neobacillus sp. PS3-40]|uniref:thiol-disulfide oxidoreductase DCC family protein n=1 Tax=Neobacillus sp. PS3-40 TaxID=3070679 RepID=UPI0027E13F0B|nr:thiol-disulfide oxidoreductase DCC family protein [Neobacillus sp. PS3-40]WML44444.1 thiol-disulfide oxidoreductase DCC family protein [Neobacillus sp. PS3-40]